MTDARPTSPSGGHRPRSLSAMAGMSDRTARIIASLAARTPVDVVPLTRLAFRGLAVKSRRTIYIRPGEVDLPELLLLAQSITAPPFAMPGPMPLDADHASTYRMMLRRRFRGIDRMSPPRWEGGDPIGMSEDELPLAPMTDAGVGVTSAGDPAFVSVAGPTLINGSREEEVLAFHAWLDDPAHWIQPPRPPMNAALARVPITVIGAIDHAEQAASRHLARIESSAARMVISRMTECYRRSLQGHEVVGDVRRRTFGRHLDANGLVELGLMRRGVPGPPPRAFRRSRRRVDDSFDPSVHAGIIMIDANAFERVDGFAAVMKHVRPLAVVASIIEVLHRLSIPFGIVMYADQQRSAGSGPPVYVNRPIVIKRPEDPWDLTRILQLDAAFEQAHTRPLPRMTRATWESVHFAHGLGLARQWFGDRSPSKSLHVCYMGLDGPGRVRPTDRDAARRVAMDIDADLLATRDAMGLTLVHGVAMVAQELRDAAPVGSLFEDLRVTW